MKSFAELFKKYRLHAEFPTFTSFGNALGEKGYYYEDSIFSHWQKGTRVPSSRHLVIKIIEIFIEKKALKTMTEANQFLSSAGLGYLTQKEKEQLKLRELTPPPFQVPSEIVHFIGREKVLEEVERNLLTKKVVLLYGAAGVGKTAIAIKLGYLFREQFPDGVLWYKVDSSNVMDILLSIAYLFGENISEIKSVHVRSSIVRTLLTQKKVLLILDNVTSKDDISLLLPNTPTSSVIISSQEKLLNISAHYHMIKIEPFTPAELLGLFEIIFTTQYVKKNKKAILKLGEKLGNLPLAIHISAHIIASYLKKFHMPIDKYLEQLNFEQIDLKSLHYEDKNLFRATTIAFNTLNDSEKVIFISLGIFEGKDFGLDTIAFINNLTQQETDLLLQSLRRISFIQEAGNKRFRIHPLLKIFARQKLKDSIIYLRAAKYYEKLLTNYQKDKLQFNPAVRQETDNIIYIFKKCYEFQYWDPITNLWNYLEKLLYYTKEIDKLRSLAESVHQSKKINFFQKILVGYYIFLILGWFWITFGKASEIVWQDTLNVGFVVLTLMGGVFGFFIAKSWGFFKNKLGKAITFLSAGLVGWSLGNAIVVYYNFILHMRHPYPSYAEIFFIPCFIFFAIGIFSLSQAAGTKYKFLRKKGKIFFVSLFLLVLIVTLGILAILVSQYGFISASLPFLKLVINIIYAFIFVVLLTLALTIFSLSIGFFGGRYRMSMYSLLLGFIVIYLSVALLYTKIATNSNDNGSLSDLIYAGGFFLIIFGLWGFYKPKHLSS